MADMVQTVVQATSVGSIVRLPHADGFRVWRVTGCYLGADSEEELLGLEVLDRKHGHANGYRVVEMLVPVMMVMAIVAQGQEADDATD